MLCSADAVFYSIIQNIHWDVSDIAGCVVTFLFAFFAGYCGLRYLGKGTIDKAEKPQKQHEPLIAETVLWLLSIVYIFFCAIQVVYLFGGRMKLPDGYTYAEYAREGFFQLLVVCILNLLIVLFVLKHFEKRPVIKALLTVISCCTYVMVASSAFRMTLYVQNYYLSFLRVLTFWMLLVIALILAGIMIQIYKSDFPLFRYGIIVKLCKIQMRCKGKHPKGTGLLTVFCCLLYVLFIILLRRIFPTKGTCDIDKFHSCPFHAPNP